MNSIKRRSILTALATGPIALAGCNSGEAIRCESSPTVLELQTKVVRIRFTVKQRSAARRLAESFSQDGYVTSVFDEVEFVGNAEDVVVEVIGDVSRKTVVARAKSLGIEAKSIEIHDADNSSISTVGGGVKLPWDAPVLKRRAEYLGKVAKQLTVEMPAVKASKLRVGVETTDEDAVKLVRELFRPGGRFTASLVRNDETQEDVPTFTSGIGRSRRIADGGVDVQSTESGVRITAEPDSTNLYIFELLHPTRSGELPPPPETARVVFSMDGSEFYRRPLTDLEHKYLNWFEENPTRDPPSSYQNVPIVLSNLGRTQAVRVAGALHAPTGTQNTLKPICES